MPSPLPQQVGWSLFARLSPSPAALPVKKSGWLLQLFFPGPAQRSLMLWPARSPSRQATLYTESSDSFVASTAASIARRELHPLKSSAFHGALFRQLSEFTVRN